jgi:hypothetical protein
VEFLDDTPGDRFILVFTYDLTNVRSWENQAWILSVLAETRAVTALAVEGAFGPFDFARFRAFPDSMITREVAVDFLRNSKLAPPSFVGMTASEPIEAFGIDDRELYEIAEKYVLAKNSAYFDAIQRRAPRMLDNTLSGMTQRNLSVVAACLTDYNYDEFRRLLRERKIAHAGIRPRVGGPSVTFEEFWTTIKTRTPLDDLFNPRPGLLRRCIGAIRRWLRL